MYLLKGRGGGRQYKIGREDKVDKMEKRRTEKKWKKGRVPGINKSVKFYIIKDFMDCD